ncbi:hypothetical protein ABIE26_002716 [Pedobacter africanus]|uniref:Uncharacterized protein n=1 Tax=Pedobacter africanus TaxID=151894 RepID=A0ACC6KX03_9SPHI|nr:hypothetical protein [Pedobacter africanus]
MLILVDFKCIRYSNKRKAMKIRISLKIFYQTIYFSDYNCCKIFVNSLKGVRILWLLKAHYQIGTGCLAKAGRGGVFEFIVTGHHTLNSSETNHYLRQRL